MEKKMAKDTNQGKTPQPKQSQKITIDESRKDVGSGKAGGAQRVRKGTAGDGTGSTGPREK